MLVANRRARTVMWDDRLTTRSDLPLATEALCRLLGSCGNEVHMSTSLGGGVVSRVELDRRRLRSFDPFWAGGHIVLCFPLLLVDYVTLIVLFQRPSWSVLSRPVMACGAGRGAYQYFSSDAVFNSILLGCNNGCFVIAKNDE